MQLDDFVLYLDENLDNCEPIILTLTAQLVRFERHRTHFPRGTEDELWLAYVGERGWAVLTKDKRNRYNQLEKDAVRRSRVREFYFGSGNMTGQEMAAALLAALPELRRLNQQEDPPLVVSITRSGSTTIVFDKNGPTHDRRKKGRAK